MGCGGSKETASVPLGDQPQQAPRPQTAKNRPPTSKGRPGTSSLADRPPSRRDRPGSRQSSSQRPHSSSHRTHPSSHRPQSSSHRPQSQSQRQRDNLKRQSRTPHPILEEQPPEDSVIHHEIHTLSALIDQHAQNYYSPHSGAGNIPTTTFVRQHIGRTIVKDIINGNMDDEAVANQLSDSLGPYAKDSANRSRRDHLITLCETGTRIKQMTHRHPSNWTFGSWESRQGAAVQFPSVLKDQYEVMPAEYE